MPDEQVVDIKKEVVVQEPPNFFLHAVGITLVVVLLLLLLWKLYRNIKAKANTFLIVGLNDAGKTVLYAKLINPNAEWATYTSMQENIYDQYLSNTGAKYQLVEYPGAERLRRNLFTYWLSQQRNLLKGIIFVVDSSTFHKKVRDVAEFMYDVLFESDAKIPILVACNKQDHNLAKNCKVIENSIEREFGLINISREAALTSISGETTKRVLSNSGKDFKWSDIKKLKVSFVECCSANGDSFNIQKVKDFIEHIL